GTTPPQAQPSVAPSEAVSKQQDVPSAPVSHLEALSNYVSRPASHPQSKAKAEPVGAEAFSSLVSNTPPSPTLHAAAAEPVTPTIQSAASVDIELETTMKRPAVRLQ